MPEQLLRESRLNDQADEAVTSAPSCEFCREEFGSRVNAVPGHDIINKYLEELSRLTKWHREHDVITFESTDYLHREVGKRFKGAAFEQVAWERAQNQAIAKYGPAKEIALENARSASGELQVARPATRAAGVAAWIAAPFLLSAAGIIIVAALGVDLNEPLFYGMFAGMTVGLCGLAAGLVGLMARVGSATLSQGLSALVASMWALLWATEVRVWMAASLLLTPAVAVLIHRSRRVTGRRVYVMWSLVGAWPLAAAVAVTFYWSGSPFNLEDFDLGSIWAAATGVLLMGVGSAALGHQLVSEASVPKELLPEPPDPAPNPFAPGRQADLATTMAVGPGSA